MKIYIAGPMRGYKELNAPAFIAATEALRDEGHTVISPIELDEASGGVAVVVNKDGTVTCTDDVFRECIARDVAKILSECDAVYILPGWEKSLGARIEVMNAMMIGLKLFFDGPPPSRKTWCEAWKTLGTCGCSSYDRFVGVTG